MPRYVSSQHMINFVRRIWKENCQLINLHGTLNPVKVVELLPTVNDLRTSLYVSSKSIINQLKLELSIVFEKILS